MRRSFTELAASATLIMVTSMANAQPSASPGEGRQAPPSTPLPNALVQNDPMLEPIDPPPHTIATWGQALATLKARSTDLRIALDEIDRSQGLWRQALAASLPTLTGTGNVTSNLLRGDVPTIDATGNLVTVRVPDALTTQGTLTIAQPVLALRAWNSVGTAKIARQQAELSAEDQKRLLTIALANAVVSVVTAERLSEVNRIGLRAALDRLLLARRRMDLGAGNALDTVRAEQDVAVVRSSIVSGDESLRKAREGLGLALGSTEAWGVPIDIDLNGLEASAQASCGAASTLEERADIAAARKSTDIAKRNINDAWLLFAPTINLVSSMNAASTQFGNGLHEAWTISGVLTVPFFDGGLRYGALQSARAQADESRQQLEAARRNATVQIIQARRAVDVAETSRQVAEQSRDLARETERLSRIAFQVGTGTSLDLIESGRRLREAESQLALQEFGLVQARIAALLALSRCHW